MENKRDPVVEDVVKKFRKRSELGIKKYGTTLDDNHLSLKEWLTHAMEESMDQTLYMNKIIMTLDNYEKNKNNN